jgi:hypothetical protein
VPGETVSQWWRRVSDHWWDREGAHGVWWVPDEAPGALGGPELWIDETALDYYGRGDASPAVTVTPAPGRPPGSIPWIGAVIRFNRHPGLERPAVYKVTVRRWSTENGGRPYYVCTWPD